MSMLKHKFIVLLLGILLALPALVPAGVSAACPPGEPDCAAPNTSANTGGAAQPTDLGSTSFNSKECPSGQARYDTGEGSTCCPTSVAGTAENKIASACAFAKYINPIISLLSALVGVAVVISIIVGAIQFSSAGGDPQKTAAAKDRIRNSIIALVAFVFLFSAIQWLIPGGIL